jgi:hypothetical protein
MNRDGLYGVYKICDSDGVIVYVGHSSDTIDVVELNHRSSSGSLADELGNKGVNWTFSWMLGPKRTSSAQIAKLATGVINKHSPRFN